MKANEGLGPDEVSTTANRKIDPIAETRRQWMQHDYGNLEHMEATSAIMRLQQVILGRITKELVRFDLSFQQYEALLLLDFSNEGVLPLGVMARRLLLHPAKVTTTVDQLEKQGFAVRVRHPTDRRMVLATITESGRRAGRSANEALGKIRYGLDEMPEDDAKSISSAVRRFREEINDFAPASEPDYQ
jgi:DNA-binding MarR family transcriptional regulator